MCRVPRPAPGGAAGLQGLRLRNRRKGVAGNLVQVQLRGEWGGVCDEGLSLAAASVVCRQLGFSLGARAVVREANKDGKGGCAVLGRAECTGSEPNLGDCSLSDKVTRLGPVTRTAVIR